jgi:hypothetical protein
MGGPAGQQPVHHLGHRPVTTQAGHGIPLTGGQVPGQVPAMTPRAGYHGSDGDVVAADGANGGVYGGTVAAAGGIGVCDQCNAHDGAPVTGWSFSRP